MKITELVRSEKECERCDYRQAFAIEIDGERVFSVHDGEPEDSNLGRDFSDCYSISSLMKRAWLAGKAGEEFIVEAKEDDEI